MTPMEHRVWAITGIPGTGKTTLAKRLAQTSGRLYISSSEMVAERDPTMLLEGRMADADVMKEAFLWTMDQVADKEIVLDGFPRTVDQSVLLPESTLVILLRCREDIAADRLARRGRDDDTPGIIRKRIEEQTRLLGGDFKDSWSGQLAGWSRCLSTGSRTREDVFTHVWDYLTGVKREVY